MRRANLVPTGLTSSEWESKVCHCFQDWTIEKDLTNHGKDVHGRPNYAMNPNLIMRA